MAVRSLPEPAADDHDDWCLEDLDDPWGLEPEDRSVFPSTDADARLLVDRAVQALAAWRNPAGPGDAGTIVSVLVSLAGHAEDRLADAVADTRDQGYTWAEIAERLATSASTARRRYSAYCRWREEGCPWPMTPPTTDT